LNWDVTRFAFRKAALHFDQVQKKPQDRINNARRFV
jgi:hypothetical protein